MSQHMRTLLSHLRSDGADASLLSVSQLSLAIARQQQIHQQLQQQLESYRQILYSAPLGYLQLDDENRLIWCNLAARALLEINRDYTAHTPRLLLELVRSYELDALIEETRSSEKPQRHDWVFYPVSPDPTQLSQQQPCALRGYGFPLLAGQVGIFLENRQEAVTLTQQRDRWASDVAHELKTPLTSIRLVAETLHSRLDPPLQGWVERLINETIRLSNLVQDLLDLSQIDLGYNQSLDLKIVNLSELVASAWLNLEPLTRKKQLHLDYQGPTDLLIQVDEARLYRVLINLLDNSIKYSPPWQTVRVQNFDRSSGRKQLRSSSAGASRGNRPRSRFPDEALPYVFERFYRADPARSQRLIQNPYQSCPLVSSEEANSGPVKDIAEHYTPSPELHPRNSSGLGLAIVKQIVEAHGGSVHAQNHPETGGAWIEVLLPWKPLHRL
ncbi:MAG: HAMP domain-containing histidine kinase [Leptolyngbyaceae cyanobacterium SL_7_1]|nr:HAMP domain-containing histidine kinase [Leptolyngbyaceae cyanobacterium SL_7_1]